jgi:hypothetical protein
MSLTGHCLCGQFSFTADAEPQFTAVCHCRNCQRQSGSALSIIVGVPDASLTTSGSLKTYEDTADSGAKVNRKFCPECGSPIFSVIPSAPGLTWIKAGTLDDVDGLAPQAHLWCKSAQPWVDIDEELPQFEANPPSA